MSGNEQPVVKEESESMTKVDIDEMIKERVEAALKVRLVEKIQSSTHWSMAKGKEPALFSGALRGQVCTSWLMKMDAYLMLLKSQDPLLTDVIVAQIALTFLEGVAYDFGCRVRDRLGEFATWLLLRKELSDRFGLVFSSFTLLAELEQVKQKPGMSVVDFAGEFELKLERLIAVGSDDALTAVSFFMKGLSGELRTTLLKSFILHSENPIEKLIKLDSRTANS